MRARAAEDALAASVELHDNDRFVFAEPSFIEHIPPRFHPSGPEERAGQLTEAQVDISHVMPTIVRHASSSPITRQSR